MEKEHRKQSKRKRRADLLLLLGMEVSVQGGRGGNTEREKMQSWIW